MKSYFVRFAMFTFAAGLLMTAGSAFAQQKLRLFLEGPFVLCEKDSQHLEILIPPLVQPGQISDHFTPGIKSHFSEKELARNKNYSLVPDPAGTANMALDTLQGNYNNKITTVMVDHIVGQCSGFVGKYYSSVTIRKPDRIRPIDPVMALVYDCSLPKPTKKGAYGTSTELIYNSVDLQKLRLEDNTGGNPWAPQVDQEDGFLTIFMRPRDPDTLTHAAALESYKRMMPMVGIKRCFEDPDLFFEAAALPGSTLTRNTVANRKKPTKAAKRIFIQHADCHAPQLLVCKTANCQ